MEFSFPRYLNAKRTVDDRALNRLVLQRLIELLDQNLGNRAARILEIGMGTGTMLQRMVEWGVIRKAHYTGLDQQVENVAAAREGLTSWANLMDLEVIMEGEIFRMTGRDNDLTVNLLAVNLFDYLTGANLDRQFDLLIANAFLDLIAARSVLPRLRQLLTPGGLAYLTINFDGVTVFEPQYRPDVEAAILALYHRSMDERVVDGKQSGSSQTGRRLFGWLNAADFDLVAAGSSDWIVYPHNASYPSDEAYFLHHMIHFFEETLRNHPQLNPADFSDWISTRHGQIDSGELVYLAHQVDFLARVRADDHR